MEILADTSTALLIAEAQKRGITATSFPQANPHVFLLEHGDRREAIYYTSTDRLGHVTFKIFLNKGLSDAILTRGGFPVPASTAVKKLEDVHAFLDAHKRIVVKPINSTWGKGVTSGITDTDEATAAFELAVSSNAKKAKTVVCQEHIDGMEYRLLVIDMQHVFSVRRVPAHVVGDGEHTVTELIDLWNAKVPDDRKLSLSDAATRLLDEQGFAGDSVPATGVQVFLKRVANAHAGGIVEDATDVVGDEAKRVACEVAKYFKAQIVGVDCITPDIGQDIGRIIELNSTPDITLHHNPTVGEPRNAAAAIIDMLFPETASS